MTEENKKENKEEEIIELFQDQIPVLTYEELIKQENIFRYPTLVGANLFGGKAIFGSGDKIMRFEQDKGLWLGNANFNLAPFRVNMSGDVVANSITINGVTGEQISYVANPTADAVPTGLTCSSTGITTADDGTISAYVVLTWNAISSDTFDHYVVRYKKSSHTYYTQITATTNTITIDGLVPNISYDFGVASVNKYGTVSNFSSDISQTTASDTTPPATVTGVSATAGIQYVILEWTHNTENDLDSYNIYRNTTNDSETATLIGNVKTNYFIDGGREGDQTYYYWIKAVDTSGNISTNFSSEVYATPRNVTSDDVTTIAASKVLIDGTVYLSNWRHSSDFTKIDGGKIYAGSVTTTQLNFTPITSTNVIASINASEEGIKIEADNITIGGATTFESGYDPTTKTAKVGGTYDSALSGARVRIFPDSNTGIQIIDDSGNDVFKALVGGTNVGDVIIGNYAGGQGIFYDKSENKTTFAGNLSAASGTLGTITAGSFNGCTITGGTIQTASSGARIKLDSTNYLQAYDSSGYLRVKLTTDSLRFNNEGGTERGYIKANTSDIIIENNYGGYLILKAGASPYGIALYSGGNAIAVISTTGLVMQGTYGISLGSEATVDGVDISAHASNANAHHSSTSSGITIYPAGCFPYTNGGYDLGSSSYYWNKVYCNYINFNPSYGYIQLGGTTYMTFWTASKLSVAFPFGFQVRAGTPGAASSYQGYMYFDTNQQDLVFSNGTNWYKITAQQI